MNIQNKMLLSHTNHCAMVPADDVFGTGIWHRIVCHQPETLLLAPYPASFVFVAFSVAARHLWNYTGGDGRDLFSLFGKILPWQRFIQDGKLCGFLKLLMLTCRRKCHCFPCIRPGIPPHSCVYGTKFDTMCDLCLVLEGLRRG